MVGTVSSFGCLAWGVPALVPIGSFVWPGLGAMEPTQQLPGVFTPFECFALCLPPASLSPGEPQQTSTCPGHSPRPAGSLTQAPIKWLLLPWVLACMKFYVWSLICSVAKSCPTLCDPMDCNTPGFPVHHQLLDPTQTHVHWVSDVVF